MVSVFSEGLKNHQGTFLKFENTDYKIKVYPESAWAVYDQNWYNNEGELVRLNINVRFLEKVQGKWKIVYVSTINTTSYDEEIEEGEEESETKE